MLTRRENLLVRPWQQRRFHHHRKKVESALPVIDVGPPVERGHVTCKLKQVQSEEERCAQISRDNCALVLRLAHIMRTSRVDNGWRQPPPTFLRRVGIYLDPACPFPSRPCSRPLTGCRAPLGSAASSHDGILIADDETSRDSELPDGAEVRNLSCSACHPRSARRREQRLASLREGRRHRPRDLPDDDPSRRPQDLLDDDPGRRPETDNLSPQPPGEEAEDAAPPPTTSIRKAPRKPCASAAVPLDQVVITYKALRLAISFPPHASVRIRSAKTARQPRPTTSLTA